MNFFIVTPTFNSLRWLPGCVASVRAQVALGGDAVDGCQMVVDQDGKTPQQLSNDHSSTEPALQVHHHIQDGGSSDGTVEFLKEYVAQQPSTGNYQLTFASEADEGMYDAINKGWDRADDSVDWLGHLNSDEQYQPGTLARIAQSGVTHPSWGAITGNCIWVDEQGRYLCSRKPSIGWSWIGRMGIPASTCALFIRRKFYGSAGVRFDTSWKSYGDKVFCSALIDAGCRFGWLDDYMALFTHRGDENLGFQPITEVERQRYWNEALNQYERKFSPLIIALVSTSRHLRFWFGQPVKKYSWIDQSGVFHNIIVKRERTKI